MIGLFGGTCNNMYVFAKVLADNDYAIRFIEDRDENFPHSQPVWDDVDVYFNSGFDSQKVDWSEFEVRYDWQPPFWYFRPEKIKNGEHRIFELSRLFLPVRYLACRYLRPFQEALSVFNAMMECDFLIVCGIKASILAMLTGKPYMIFPHGSDMRVAIGAESKGKGIKGRLIESLVTKSFQSASFIGSSLPDASAEVAKSEYRKLKDLKIERLPLPYQSESRLGDAQRRKKLKELFGYLNTPLPEKKIYCFSPSRINFHWKGHDRLLRVINEKQQSLEIHFIFLGWGDDYVEAMEYVTKNDLDEFVTVLPVFLSKQFLFRFFKSVDFIIDELNGSGSYGTSLSEAMSVGCPVVTWISEMFDQPGWLAPPVISARTEEELGETVLGISSGEIDLSSYSEKVVDWFNRVHDSTAVLPVLDQRMIEECKR